MKSSKERDAHKMKPRPSNPATQKRGTKNRSAFINSVLGKQKKKNFERYTCLLFFVVFASSHALPS
jgi:hypothetical protein